MPRIRHCLRSSALALGLLASPAAAEGEGSAGGPPMSDTTVALGIEPVGLAPYPLSSSGYRLGYVPSPAREIELSVVEAEKTVLLAHIALKEYELRYRAWLSDTVYAGFGVGLRNVDITYDVFMLADAPDTHVVEKHRMIIANVHFGVEYSVLGPLFVGVDMLGLAVPVHVLDDGDDFPDSAENYEEDPKTYPYIESALKTSYQLVRVFAKVRI